MSPTLPLELQLHILELALPPLIRRNLDERVRLCKAFSLVHRDWTKTAQRELHEHITVTCWQLDSFILAARDRILAAHGGGWSVKRLDARLRGTGGAIILLEEGQGVEWSAIEEMWVNMDEGDFAELGADGLRRLHIYDVWRRGLLGFLHALPTRLTYLGLHNVSLRDWSAVRLPALEVLILDLVADPLPWATLIPSHVKLRVLACRCNFPRIDTDTLANMPQLHHFIAVFDTTYRAADLWPALFDAPDPHSPPVRLPQRLQTFTCLATKYDPLPDDQSGLTSLKIACEELGTVLAVRLDLTNHEVRVFDLEEWAHSVGV
ncbi:hypothetical protein NBRC10512_007401 [Rhodotorula toruloides]|uniref:RHTO0S12e03004g1_1 n=2 Tax=Rhodotorula toruloides TaxID=5286 RepID=A0A061B8S3_RHOTO|nr:uncharacterized protein RHTO_07549 [Rhodotorula toruloides NP11]EMS23207.1 hypothetical protein RHTO_07549 [Rhodotorula toruloides NP11]KAJ8291730.1 hypothetical protein OF846_004982 [Rhodotorula toruloides]CDR46323.1 RHTO0S12e03004g1_1 [Rhodotorula toruloides]